MRIHHLGPHTFFTSQTHERHHDWLTRFKPRQRRDLIEEDYHARMQVFAVIVGAMLFGLISLIVALVSVL